MFIGSYVYSFIGFKGELIRKPVDMKTRSPRKKEGAEGIGCVSRDVIFELPLSQDVAFTAITYRVNCATNIADMKKPR